MHLIHCHFLLGNYMLRSFLELPNKFLENRLFVNYAIRSVYRTLLLRSPSKSELPLWSTFIRSNGIVDFVKEVSKSEEWAALSANIDSKRVLFMHIPKAAGTSFRYFFTRFTKKIFLLDGNWDGNLPNDTTLLIGHFGFSVIKAYSFSHSFTILRDPVERIISLYRYGNSEVSGWVLDDPVRTLNFHEWILSDTPEVLKQIDSFYVRTITDDLPEPFESRVADSVELALKRFSKFSAVGDQFNLEPFCKKVALLLDIPIFTMPLYNSANHHAVSSNKYPPRPKLTPEIQSRLGQLTRLDYEIYNRFRAK